MSASTEDIELTETQENTQKNDLSDVSQSSEGIFENRRRQNQGHLSRCEEWIQTQCKSYSNPHKVRSTLLSVAKTSMKRHRPHPQRINLPNSLLDLNSLMDEIKIVAATHGLFSSPQPSAASLPCSLPDVMKNENVTP